MELQIFSNSEFGEIRTITKDNEPMFCLADVCKALEISNVGNVKQRLSEKGIHTADTLTKGGMQKMTFISEANLYKTIFQSRKESAERFTDWVTSEVLPSIRKTGSYSKPLTTSDIYKQLKREFGCVATYKSIRRKYIDNVHKFIDDYALPMALAEQVKEANAQISMSF